MAWQDFGLNSALERDTLLRALPLMPTQSSGKTRAKIDIRSGTAQVAIHVEDTLGAHVRQRNPFEGSPYGDLIVEFRDRPGMVLRGRLENAPNDIVKLTPNRPPDWAS